MYVICLASGGYSENGSLKEKGAREAGNTCFSRSNMIYCQEGLIIHPLISELIHPDIIWVGGVCATLLAQQNARLHDLSILPPSFLFISLGQCIQVKIIH